MQDVGDSRIFMQHFKLRLSDNLKQNWYESIESLSLSFSYKHYKSLLHIESYLSLSVSPYLRSLLAKFRCSNFGLHIETGRYTNIPHEERLCPYCKLVGKYFIENEIHVLFICKLYDDVRNKLITPYLKSTDNNVNLIYILGNTNTDVQTNLCHFLKHVSKNRKSVSSM